MEELFDIVEDPYCANNLADKPEFEATRNSMWEKLQATLKEHGDPRMEGKGEIFDQYPVTNPDKAREVEDRFRIARETGKFFMENNP